MKVRSPHCIILICILISSQPLFAEESENSETRYYRHEVNVSRTGMFLPTSQWKDYEDMDQFPDRTDISIWKIR